MSADPKRRYKLVLKWFRANRDKRRVYNKRYYAKNAERRRQIARQERLKNPERNRQHNLKFRAKYPNYMREYAARKRMRLAWLKWSIQCAQSRKALGEAA
jgi:hypothetical protein